MSHCTHCRFALTKIYVECCKNRPLEAKLIALSAIENSQLLLHRGVPKQVFGVFQCQFCHFGDVLRSESSHVVRGEDERQQTATVHFNFVRFVPAQSRYRRRDPSGLQS
jgi:hypothetical protein